MPLVFSGRAPPKEINVDIQTNQKVLDEIAAAANDVRAAGDQISKRIVEFEWWLNKLPGKVQSSCVLWHDDGWPVATYLGFEKKGTSWALGLYAYDERTGEISNQMLLRDASLDAKIAAVERFPVLLEAIAKSQKELVQRIATSNSEYDKFAASLGIKRGA